MTLRLAGTENDSIVDGPGIRFTIFVQGCPHHCPGCHNPQTHDFAGGTDTDCAQLLARIDANPCWHGSTPTPCWTESPSAAASPSVRHQFWRSLGRSCGSGG